MLERTVFTRRALRTTLPPALTFFLLLSLRVNAQPDQATKAGTPKGEVLNLLEKHKDEYVAKRQPVLVDVGPATYLTITGRGGPGSETFVKGIGTLYGAAYTLKMKTKFAAGRDYMICPLGCLWWGTNKSHGFVDEPKEAWNWKLLIRTPDFITKEDVAAAVGQSAGQGAGAGEQKVKLETLNEGRCVQVLHIGPYDKETETIATMLAYAKEQGLSPAGPHHEIYLSDPNRAAPEKLRTILRQPVKPSAAGQPE